MRSDTGRLVQLTSRRALQDPAGYHPDADQQIWPTMRETTSYLLEDAQKARRDRDAYYRKGLEYLGNNSIRGVLCGRQCRFHWNINLYVEMMSWCNGKCWFCINRVNYQQPDTSDQNFIERFEETLQQVRFLDPSVQLAGGEPTLLPERTRAVMELVRKYQLRKPVITSNGSGLVEDHKLLDDIQPILAHLNISRHHDDQGQLNQIMGFANPLGNTELLEILRAHPIAEKIRLNCCLQADGIRSFEDIERYLDWALGMGVQNVCFSTLSRLPEDYMYQEELVRLAREKYVDLAPIADSVTRDPRFAFLKFHSGSHCMYEVWRYTRGSRSCVVVLATSNNHFARALDQIDDLFELLVFHADGVLTGSWNRHCKVV